MINAPHISSEEIQSGIDAIANIITAQAIMPMIAGVLMIALGLIVLGLSLFIRLKGQRVNLKFVGVTERQQVDSQNGDISRQFWPLYEVLNGPFTGTIGRGNVGVKPDYSPTPTAIPGIFMPSGHNDGPAATPLKSFHAVYIIAMFLMISSVLTFLFASAFYNIQK